MLERKSRSDRAETTAAAHGVATDPAFGSVVPPLYLSSTYEFAGFDTPRAYDYGRSGNPTRDLLAKHLRSSREVPTRLSRRAAWPRSTSC